MVKKNKKAFTLIELLAVITILGLIIILVMPKVATTINNSKKRTLELTAKSIINSAEEKYFENHTIGIREEIKCEDIANIKRKDYKSCKIEFNQKGNAFVTIIGNGKYEDLNVCEGTKKNTVAGNDDCSLKTLIVNLDGGTDTVDYEEKYLAGSTITLTEPTKEDYVFLEWVIVSGTGARLLGNELTMGSSITEVKAVWGKNPYGANYIKNLLKNEDTLHNGLVQTTATISGQTVDAGIRYVGSIDTVKNKVYFNCKDTYNGKTYGSNGYEYNEACEVWRIIGVFDTKTTENDTTSKKRIKIVRDSLSKTMSWDSSASDVNSGSGINQWGPSGSYGGSDVMTMLNSYYIRESSTCSYYTTTGRESDCTSSISQLSATSISMLEDVVWYLGAVKDADTLSLSTMYAGERGNQTGKVCSSTHSTFGENCNDKVTRTKTWVGKVGLIYPSDWAYASGSSGCASNLHGSSASTCEQQNWLHPSADDYWTISPAIHTYFSYISWYISTSFNASSVAAKTVNAIKPTAYLAYYVQIVGGDGYETPYILSVQK